MSFDADDDKVFGDTEIDAATLDFIWKVFPEYLPDHVSASSIPVDYRSWDEDYARIIANENLRPTQGA